MGVDHTDDLSEVVDVCVNRLGGAYNKKKKSERRVYGKIPALSFQSRGLLDIRNLYGNDPVFIVRENEACWF